MERVTLLQTENGFEIPIRDKSGIIVCTALCSEADFECFSQLKWHRSKHGYIKTGTHNGETFMHRIVMRRQGLDIPTSHVVDHINGEKHDNRRSVLRISSMSQNANNKRKRKGTSSLKYGVSLSKASGKFRAEIQIMSEKYHLGEYDSEELAARAYDKFLLERADFDGLGFNLNYPLDRATSKSAPAFKKRARKSVFRGVSPIKTRPGFVAKIVRDGKHLIHKYCMDELSAARAVDDCIVKNGLAMKLNFPEEHIDYVPTKKIKTAMEDTNDPDVVRVILRSRPNIIVLIDREKYDQVKHYSLTEAKGYVNFGMGTKNYKLHRYLMQATDPNEFVDHIDNNPFNNVLSNLQLANARQNAENRRKSAKSSSRYQGVFKTKRGKFTAQSQGKMLKYYRTHVLEEDAARDYDLTVMTRAPESRYKLNFVWTPEDIATWKTKLNK